VADPRRKIRQRLPLTGNGEALFLSSTLAGRYVPATLALGFKDRDWRGTPQRSPMLLFVFVGALFQLDVQRPLFEPLFQLPPKIRPRDNHHLSSLKG